MRENTADERLTAQEAYAAMFLFLDSYFDRKRQDELTPLLGELVLFPDGKPLDPAHWQDWIDIVKIVKSGKYNISSRNYRA